MGRPKKGSIRDANAEAVDKDIRQNEYQAAEEREDRSLDEELDFDNHDFSIIEEEEL